MQTLLYYLPMLFVLGFAIMFAVMIKDSVSGIRKQPPNHQASIEILEKIRVRSKPCNANLFNHDVEPDFSGYLE